MCLPIPKQSITQLASNHTASMKFRALGCLRAWAAARTTGPFLHPAPILRCPKAARIGPTVSDIQNAVLAGAANLAAAAVLLSPAVALPPPAVADELAIRCGWRLRLAPGARYAFF